MELLGVVGEYAAELRVYQLHFGVKPCRYPAEEAWALRPADAEAGGRLDCTHLRVFSVDNASTRDIDDALSLELAAGVADACPADDARATSEWAAGVSGTLGVHVADVASRVPCDSPLFAWAFGRASSCYHGGVDGEGPGGSVPMLPPELAHGELSLNEGARRNALSVFLRIEGGAVVECWHAQTSLINNNATTYAAFGQDATPYGRAARALLRRLSGEHEPEELVAWTMIKYNSYLGALLSSRGDAGGIPAGAGLLRVQPVANEAATYGAARGAADARTHAGLALVDYAHCSSPIRRYADLHNQHVLASTLGAGGVLDATRLAVLNERAAQVSHYHAMTSAMELAHACRKEPKTFACRVETDEDGTALRVYTERGRVKVPLRDSYFAEPLAAHFAGAAGDVKVQLYGVLKNGRTQLRVRVQEVAAAALNLRSPLAAAATDAPAAAATDAPAMAAPPGLTGRGGRGRGGRGAGRGAADAPATAAPPGLTGGGGPRIDQQAAERFVRARSAAARRRRAARAGGVGSGRSRAALAGIGVDAATIELLASLGLGVSELATIAPPTSLISRRLRSTRPAPSSPSPRRRAAAAAAVRRRRHPRRRRRRRHGRRRQRRRRRRRRSMRSSVPTCAASA